MIYEICKMQDARCKHTRCARSKMQAYGWGCILDHIHIRYGSILDHSKDMYTVGSF
jgi:hypothetical protein